MWGFQIGTLELIADEQVVWSRTDRQQDAWLFAQVRLPAGVYEVRSFEEFSYFLFPHLLLKPFGLAQIRR